jgi:hypothetical protein
MTLRTIVTGTLLTLICSPALATAQQQKPAGQSLRPPTFPMEQIQGFHVVLVVGETQRSSNAPSQNLPEGAAEALNDMREFLPYKHYRVLDAQWSSCCAGPQTKISGRLQGVIGVPGPNGSMNLVHRPYAFNITARSAASGIQTRFVLTAQDGRGRQHPDDRAELERNLTHVRDQLATLEARMQETRKRVEVGIAPALELREAEDKVKQFRLEEEALQEAFARLDASSDAGVMDSSFTMHPGETVVVGTSKLGGDKALIAVVTAVRKGGSAR